MTVSIRFGGFSAQTRCPVHATLGPPLSGLHSPYGIVTSLRIKVFYRIVADQPTFRVRPISLHSPLPYLSLVSEADHRLWSATSRRLAVPQTSWNLPQYAPDRISDQAISVIFDPFSSRFFSFGFRVLKRVRSESAVDKPQRRGTVLGY